MMFVASPVAAATTATSAQFPLSSGQTPSITMSPSPAVTSAVMTTPKAAASASAPLQAATMHLTADHVIYDGSRSEIIARGNVVINTNHGMVMRGHYFAMDVIANRFVIAGHIQINNTKGTHLEGAAFASLLNYARSYYLPVVNGPDRWTFSNDDLEHPLKGRENPGDAFALPDEPHGRVWISSRTVTIDPQQHLLFGPGQLDTGVTVIPIPRFFLNLSHNPNFAENSLVGAQWDASYPIAGSANSLTTLHLREGQGTGFYTAVEEHIATQKGYLVGSIAPLDHEQKQYNVLGSTHPNKKLEIDGFAQDNLFQQGLVTTPLNAAAYLDGRITLSMHQSFAQLTVDQYYESLWLPKPSEDCNCYGGNPQHLWVPNHPIQTTLNWVGFDQRLSKLPVHYRLRSGIAKAHQHEGITPLASTTFASAVFATANAQGIYPSLVGGGVQTVTNTSLGATIYTNPIRLNRDRHGNNTNLLITFDGQHQSFSLPHHIDTSATTLSLSKLYGTKLAAFVAYTQKQVNDNYGSQQAIAYAADPQLPGFRGFATYRDWSESFIYTPNPNFTASIIAQENHDFPVPVANYFGQAPGVITGDIRARIRPHVMLDVSRSYYVPTFGNMHWSNQFNFLIGG